ncbi:MAG: pyrroline-5-carboxylate reductase [Pseudomonadota bacterium]
MSYTVVLVGAGNMGGALLRGWISGGMNSSNIVVVDPVPPPEMSEYLKSNSIRHETSADGVGAPDVLILAIKPQLMDAVLPTLKSLVSEKTVAVSVAAGTTISTITSYLEGVAVVRTIPNTPSLVGRGITVATSSENVTDNQKENVGTLLTATGKLEWVDSENLIDSATAVSGSGPAYVFHLAECLAKAGEAVGLSPQLAMTLARETVAGAGELLYLSDNDPATLRKNVTSPGGTTAAALEVLMAEDAMPAIFEKAVVAARDRAEELS